MNKKLLSAGLLLAFVAISMPGDAYHIKPCPGLGGVGDPEAEGCTVAGASDPTEWGAQVGAAFPVNDPTGDLCDVLELVLLTTLNPTLGQLSTDIQATLGLVPQVGAVANPIVASLFLDAQTLVQDLYDFICFADGTVFGFESGDPIVGFTTCESNGIAPTITDPGEPSLEGKGGLCFMNPGFETVSGDCAFVTSAEHRGNSNGRYNQYNGAANPCAEWATDDDLEVIADVAREWYVYRMHDGNNFVEFTAQVDGISCTDAAGNLVTETIAVVDDQFAYMVDAGHVTGFPVSNPAGFPNGSGTYTVLTWDEFDTTNDGAPRVAESPIDNTDEPSSDAMIGCNGPEPWYQAGY